MFKRHREIGRIYKQETDWGAVFVVVVIFIVVIAAVS